MPPACMQANSEFRKQMNRTNPDQPLLVTNPESEYYSGIRIGDKPSDFVKEESPPKKAKVQDEEESGMCVVCEARPAMTFLDPCEHLYCCEICSKALEKDQNYHDKCIVCQQKIKSITYLKSSKIVQISK